MNNAKTLVKTDARIRIQNAFATQTTVEATACADQFIEQHMAMVPAWSIDAFHETVTGWYRDQFRRMSELEYPPSVQQYQWVHDQLTNSLKRYPGLPVAIGVPRADGKMDYGPTQCFSPKQGKACVAYRRKQIQGETDATDALERYFDAIEEQQRSEDESEVTYLLRTNPT